MQTEAGLPTPAGAAHELSAQHSRPVWETSRQHGSAYPSLLRHPLTRRRMRQLEQRQRAHDRFLAWRLQDILVGRGLTHTAFSIGGGRSLHIPEVLSVDPGPPVSLFVRLLPGQMPDDYTKHAKAIAYGLDVADIEVVGLGPSLIRIELLVEARVPGSR